MLRDINTKKVMKNAYRITKNRYITSLRVRIPGGCIDPESLMIVSKIANIDVENAKYIQYNYT